MTEDEDAILNHYTQHNRRAWNEIAGVRRQTFPPATFYAEGGVTLSTKVVSAARGAAGLPADHNLAGLRVIHLQCATGEDTLSWAVLGAQAVGVDIADEQIQLAQATAYAAGLDVRFIASDIYVLPGALPEELRGGYDFVFTGGGALVWLPDIRRWARIVSALLRKDGRLILEEEHPISACLWVENGQLQITCDYFGREHPEEAFGWSHFKGGEQAQEVKYEFSWPLGDIITALAEAGLIIERLEEMPDAPEWRYQQQTDIKRLPGAFLLIARKPD